MRCAACAKDSVASEIPFSTATIDGATIRVKFLNKGKDRDVSEAWLRFLPSHSPQLGRCHFIFDRDCRKYDWLVVYDDLPSVGQERFTRWEEVLACPRSQTLLITTEPSCIKTYGKGFLRQFEWVLTSQEPWVIRHPGAIYSQTGLIWFYDGEYNNVQHHPPAAKTSVISTVCSSKQQKHTLHHARYEFTQKLKAVLPELDIFGHGVRFIPNKNEALDPYYYHVSIENHVCRHHWTEKLADSYLGMCLPFYHGCPNVADYFPEDSYIPIDIHRFKESAERITKAIKDNEYARRLPALREARRLVLERYSTFPQLVRLIEERTPFPLPSVIPGANHGSILSRHAWRHHSIFNGLSFVLEKTTVRLRHACGA